MTAAGATAAITAAARTGRAPGQVKIGDGFLPGRDVAVVHRHDGDQVSARLFARGAPPPGLAAFTADACFFASARTLTPAASALARRLAPAAVILLGPLTARGPGPLFTTRAFRFRATTRRRVEETGSETIVHGVFGLDEARLFG